MQNWRILWGGRPHCWVRSATWRLQQCRVVVRNQRIRSRWDPMDKPCRVIPETAPLGIEAVQNMQTRTHDKNDTTSYSHKPLCGRMGGKQFQKPALSNPNAFQNHHNLQATRKPSRLITNTRCTKTKVNMDSMLCIYCLSMAHRHNHHESLDESAWAHV